MNTPIALVDLDGPNAGTYLECLGRMPQILLAAVVEPRSCRRADQGGRLQGVATFTHHRILLEQFPAEGVIVCDSGGRRKETVVDCVRAGKSILCENPISETLVEAREMWAISQAHDVLFGACLPVRFSPTCRQVRKRILEGSLGNPLTVKVRESEGGSGSSSSDSCGRAGEFRTNPATTLVDTLRWLLGGEFTLVRVIGSGDEAGFCSGWLRLEMNHGFIATVESSLMDPPGVPRMARGVRLEFSGPQGRLDLELFGRADSAGSEAGCDGPEETPIYGMLANFVEAVRGRARVAAGGMDGLRAIEVVEAARRAWKYRTAVVL